jgi:hypothetical protein
MPDDTATPVMTNPRDKPAIAAPVGRLLAGDLACYLIATIAGFATHDELAWTASARFLATWLPFSAAWLLVAPAMGAYTHPDPRRRLARSAWAAVVSTPLGAVIRGAWIGSGVVPVFVLVMAGVTAGLVLLWRLIGDPYFVRGDR